MIAIPPEKVWHCKEHYHLSVLKIVLSLLELYCYWGLGIAEFCLGLLYFSFAK